MAQDFSKHHICPTSRGGGNSKANIVKLTHKYHVAFHQVFHNLLPHSQIERLIDINGTALTRNFREDIMEILGNGTEYFYEKGILMPRKG